MQLSLTVEVFSFFCVLFCFFTVIGGKNVYLRLSVKGACDNKDPVWKKLEEEVPL